MLAAASSAGYDLRARYQYMVSNLPFDMAVTATEINASGTAGVALLPMGSSVTGFDDWQPVAVSSGPNAHGPYALLISFIGK